MTLMERKPQEETTRHDNTRVGSKALLLLCVVVLWTFALLTNITAIKY